MESMSAATEAPDRVAGRDAAAHWPAVLRVALGALFISVFFENLNKDLYTEKGSRGLIEFYIAKGSAPGPWKDVMQFIADNASIFAPMQAALELTLGILLVLGIGTGFVALAAAGHLTALWISEWATAWVWELLMLIVVAIVVALSALGRGLGGTGTRVLGQPTFGSAPMAARLLVALLAGGALAAFTVLSKNGGRGYEDAAWQSGLALAVLLLLLAFLDRVRERA